MYEEIKYVKKKYGENDVHENIITRTHEFGKIVVDIGKI